MSLLITQLLLDQYINDKTKQQNQNIANIYKTKRMNKFYNQYKDLFTQQQTTPPSSPFIKPTIPKYQSHIAYRPAAYYRNKVNNNPRQNQLSNLFKQYVQNEMNNGRKKGYESVASKQLSQVILPKLKQFDQQIERKLKRFKTEHEQSLILDNNNYSFLVNDNNNHYSNMAKMSKNNSYLTNNDRTNMPSLKADLSSSTNTEQQHQRYKHGYKFATVEDNIFGKNYQTNKNSKRNSFYKNNEQTKRIKTIQHSNNNSFQLNPQSPSQPALDKRQLKRKNFILYNGFSYQDTFQSQYQRSYSNKKLNQLSQLEQQDVNSSRFVEQQVNQKKNYHLNRRSEQMKVTHDKNSFIQIQGNLNNNEKHFKTQPLISQQQSTKAYYSIRKPSRKTSDKTTVPRFKTRVSSQKQQQQGMKFSQYSNQYAFISKRLNDIQQFSNYYHHTNINSYKKAILRRLQAKSNQEERRNRLRYLLAKDQVEKS